MAAINKEAMIKDLAERLFTAETTGKSIPTFGEEYPGLNFEDAYTVQLAVNEKKKALGWTIVGKKVGLTNSNVQKQKGLTEPDYGTIFDVSIVQEGTPIKVSTLMGEPTIEVELAFVLKRDLSGPGVTLSQAYHAVEAVVPAFEIVEYRTNPFPKTVPESICDNAACGKMILGSKFSKLDGLDLRSIGVYIEENGVLIDSACSATVLGNPLQSLAWLANKLSHFGTKLYAGEFAMTGSITLMHTVKAGSSYRAVLGNGIGELVANFVE